MKMKIKKWPGSIMGTPSMSKGRPNYVAGPQRPIPKPKRVQGKASVKPINKRGPRAR